MRAGISHKSRSDMGLRHSRPVTGDVFRVAQPIVNAYLLGQPGAAPGTWFLVDAGLPFSTRHILRAAAELYGEDSRPAAILMTHGHFDHVGALEHLTKHWDVPVFCHRREAPYLDGRASYLPADPTAGGGAMTWMSPLYPRGPVDVSGHLDVLPENGKIPGLRGWEWIPTPGHSPGHVSFFRSSDGLLIAGDAFVTTRQESMLCALLHPREVNGPPRYFTPDWEAARQSVRRLNRLPIRVAATGHGKPMAGKELRRGLKQLADHFTSLAVPAHGRYVHGQATSRRRHVSVRPAPMTRESRGYSAGPVILLAAALGAAGGLGLLRGRR